MFLWWNLLQVPLSVCTVVVVVFSEEGLLVWLWLFLLLSQCCCCCSVSEPQPVLFVWQPPDRALWLALLPQDVMTQMSSLDGVVWRLFIFPTSLVKSGCSLKHTQTHYPAFVKCHRWSWLWWEATGLTWTIWADWISTSLSTGGAAVESVCLGGFLTQNLKEEI